MALGILEQRDIKDAMIKFASSQFRTRCSRLLDANRRES